MSGIHVPVMPSWECAGCSDPWPCRSSQARLVAEYGEASTSLRLAMSMRLSDAASDLRSVPAGELHERFL